MHSASEFQILYIKLYTQLRKYIWDYSIVVQIADLEVAVYTAFPELNVVARCFDALRASVSRTDVYREDEELKEAFEEFDEAVETVDNLYLPITTFEEVIEV